MTHNAKAHLMEELLQNGEQINDRLVIRCFHAERSREDW